MRVIKVYQMLAPLSTDRVVQMVADPDNVVQCLRAVIEAVESAPPRGRREDYDAANFSEGDALNYGGWLSREAAAALAQGMPLRGPGCMPPMGYNMGGPYMMGGGDMGPMGGGMGPMGGGMGPMGGGPVPGGRGRGPRSGGGMMGGNAPLAQSQRGMMGSSGPAPVPPPAGRNSSMGPPGGYSSSADGGYGGQGGYDGSGGFDNGVYGGIDQTGQGGFSGPGYGGSGNMASGGYGSSGYGGSQRGSGDMAGGQSAPRGGTYGGYGSMGSGEHVGGKASQWYGGWS
ncbi:unnamed protein product [Schistosoma rodhaini]|nr:unnamed protein product [Schistosoma rodhaini]